MAREINSNLILINAPAGSGKTTTIEKNIIRTLSEQPKSKILCITYTNRAAKELSARINDISVKIQTIHSYINEFIKIYFTHKDVLNLYFEIYGAKIKSDIENKNKEPRLTEKNDRYKEKQSIEDEEFSYDTVRNNIKKINYNELSFNSLYYGGLSHDDLLSFAKKVINRFPVLKKRIVDKYDYIYIDEYQDTSSNVLDIFYDSVTTAGDKTKLYLLGDKMQQIYKNYDGNFEEELAEFDISQQLKINYRTTTKIVNVLNNLYNDEKYVQKPCEKAINNHRCKQPTIIITNDVNKFLKDSDSNLSNALKLYVFNRARFKAMSAVNLYAAVSSMEKYSAMSKHSAVEVLTNDATDNPDELMRYLRLISDAIENFYDKKYGKVIQEFKKHKIFNPSNLKINTHEEKIHFEAEFNKLCAEYDDNTHTLKSFIEKMIDMDILIPDKFISIFENEEYQNLLCVNILEYRNLKMDLKQPNVSTQHGVKGEGYDEVCFIAENSSNPPVKMYEFFELFSTQDVNLTDFQKFYYDYMLKLEELEQKLTCKLSKYNADEFKSNKKCITDFLSETKEQMSDNIYFDFIYAESYNKYFQNQNKTNSVPCLKPTTIFGMLTAYRLFYVGCSRAKEDLTVIVDRSKIMSYKNDFVAKMELVGFNVVDF